MTAEIVIMNQEAVAMATDSVVTIGNEYYDEKTFPSVNKLFAISYDLPIGIMVYGNGRFMGISWETLIKMYQKKHNKDLSHLKDYVQDFLIFLEKFPSFTPENQEQNVLDNFMKYNRYVRERMVDAVNNRDETVDAGTKKSINNPETIIKKILLEEINLLKECPQY